MTTTQAADPAVRCVLEGVPRVGFYSGGPRPPEDDPFPACVGAFLEWKGEPLGFAPDADGRTDGWHPWHDVHVYLMGTSGSAFRLMWDSRKWDHAITDIAVMSPDWRRPYRQALESAGYGCDFLLKKDYARSVGVEQEADPTEADFRRRIVESIRDRGRPVIAIGVIGPPECSLITGYDEAGKVLVGWSFFQNDKACNAGVEFEKSGCFRKRDWFKDTSGLILIGEKRARPSERDTALASLSFGLELMRTPEVRGLKAGQAAFTAWAEALLGHAESDWSGLSGKLGKKQMAVLRERKQIHHDNAGTLAEARAWGANYLRWLADREPVAHDELTAAAKCFDDEHDLVWAMWEFTSRTAGADGDARRLADAATRGRIVPLIRLARTRDAEAARHIEKAIAQIEAAAWEARAAHLPRNSKAVVKREGGRVWIDGVPDVQFGTGRDCAFAGSLEAATSVTERPLKYSDIMGSTGLAFRLRWSNPDTKGGWDASCPGGEYMEEWDDVQRATGWLLLAEFGGPGKEEDPTGHPTVKRIVQNIDAGWPVMGPADGPNVGLIVGYSDGGRTLLTRQYDKPAGLAECATPHGVGGFQLHLGAMAPPPEPRRALAAALRTAVRNWRRGKSSAGYAGHGKEWFYGEQAAKTWADDLAARDLAAMPENEQSGFWHLNREVYLSLVDARKAAVTYLREQAPLLTGDPRAALERAAGIYEQEIALLEAPIRLGAPWLTVTQRPASSWTTDQRGAEREMLLAATKLEAEAIGELEKAAAALADVPPASRPGDRGQYAVLQGVPRVGFDRHLSPFPGSLFSVMQTIGEPVDYDFLMGVTGACFRRFWEKDDGGNVDLMVLGREPIRRAADALHYELTVIPHKDRDRLVEALKESIARGRPVIAFGIIGPPEAGVVAGYDRGGDVLTGWSYFQDGSRPGYYQQTDWHGRAAWRDDMGFVVVGDKDRWGGPSRRDILLSSLKWAIDLARTRERPGVKGHLSGLAAYDGWADGLEVDADYPQANAQAMGWRVMVHGDQCLMLEERRSAARFLRSMAKEAPEATADLIAAAALYERAADAHVWLWGEDMGAKAQAGLADPKTRREIAAQVRMARDSEAEAVALLERAVACMVRQPAGRTGGEELPRTGAQSEPSRNL